MWRQLLATSLCQWLSKDSGKLTVITDRGTAILKGLLDTMPHVDIVFCAFHIVANINKHCKGELPTHSFCSIGLTPVRLSANGAPTLQKTGSRTKPATEPMFWAAQVSFQSSLCHWPGPLQWPCSIALFNTVTLTCLNKKAARTVREFETNMKQLKAHNIVAFEYLNAVPHIHWVSIV